jgi:hypothetical protein
MNDSNENTITNINQESHVGVTPQSVDKVKLGNLTMYKITPLDAENWLTWKASMQEAFFLNEVKDHIDGKIDKPENDPVALKEWLHAESHAYMLLHMNLQPRDIPHVT